MTFLFSYRATLANYRIKIQTRKWALVYCNVFLFTLTLVQIASPHLLILMVIQMQI